MNSKNSHSKSRESDLLDTLISKRSETLKVIGEIKGELVNLEDGDVWAVTLTEMRDDFIVQLGLLAEAINKLEEAVDFSNQKLADVQTLLDKAHTVTSEHHSSGNNVNDPAVRKNGNPFEAKKEFKKKAY